jgi:hypothetical protein
VVLVTCFTASVAHSQSEHSHFNIFAEGIDHPIVRGVTNMPDGTNLTVVLKKPWLPDGQQRLERGLAACEDDCVPPEDSVIVKHGSFATRPFSFNGKAIRAGVYAIEIWHPIGPNETLQQMQSMERFKPIFTSTVRVPASSAASLEKNEKTALISMPCSNLLIAYGSPRMPAPIDTLVEFVMGQGDGLGSAANILDFVATECRLNERITIGQAVKNLFNQEREHRLPAIPIGGATSDPKVEESWKAFEKWVHHQGLRPSFVDESQAGSL